MEASNDKNTASRKEDHINLTDAAQVDKLSLDSRFIYEPLLGFHPEKKQPVPFSFLGKQMQLPIWVSSMTGGTKKAKIINKNLARACAEFGLGMGLGSCRSLLFDDERISDFDFRKEIGTDAPFFANLGIAQLEQLLSNNALDKIDKMIDRLQVDGLIIHINPIQEWIQPEGDHFVRPAIHTIQDFLQRRPALPVIIKEVGQGMGRQSLKSLLQLPIAAIEFGAAGGTNFAKLELLREGNQKMDIFSDFIKVGHTAAQMVEWINELTIELGDRIKCQSIIASGGVKNYLDGYYLVQKCTLPTIYGQASSFLAFAKNDYKSLATYIQQQIEGYQMAEAFLTVR